MNHLIDYWHFLSLAWRLETIDLHLSDTPEAETNK